MSFPVQDLLHETSKPILAALKAHDYKQFLQIATNAVRWGQLEILRRFDPKFANCLEQLCEIVGEWGSLKDPNSKPLELERRLKLLDGLLTNRGTTREQFLRDNVAEFNYFHEVGNDRTPYGWFNPIRNGDAAIVSQMIGYIEALSNSEQFHNTFARQQLKDEFELYLLQAHFRYFGKLLHEGAGSELSVQMRQASTALNQDNDVREIAKVKAKLIDLGDHLGLRVGSIYTREHKYVSCRQIVDLKQMTDSLCIDLSRQEPQNGFGRKFSIEELAEMLDSQSSALFSLYSNDVVIGSYVIQKRLGHAPREFDGTLVAINTNKLNFRMPTAFAALVATTPEGRELCADAGLNAYDLLHESMVNSLKLNGILKVFGVVRMGAQANTAITSHLQRGWTETGIICHPYGETDYQLMSLAI